MTPPNGETAVCENCGSARPREEMDRYLWCAACVEAMQRRAARWGRGAALGVAAALAGWIALMLPPAPKLLWWWAVPVVVAYVLVGRIVRTIAVGVYRTRGVPTRAR
jgi:hypothetical protein